MSHATGIRSFAGFLSIASLLGAAVADNKITYPDKDGMTFYQGDSVTIKYVTDYASPKLHLFCYPKTGDGVLDKLETSIATGTGSQTVTIDLSGVGGCWFNIQTSGNIWGVNSPIWTFGGSRPMQQTTTPPPPAATGQTTAVVISNTMNLGTGSPAPSLDNNASPTDTPPSPTTAAAQQSPRPSSPNDAPGTSPSGGASAGGASLGTADEPTTAPVSGANSAGVSAASTGTSPNPTQPPSNAAPSGTSNTSTTTGGNTGDNSNGTGGGDGGNTGNGGGSSTTTTNNTTTNNNNNGGSDGALSPAAKAGIGAGVGVSAALAIAGLVFFLMARRKHRENNRTMAELPAVENTDYGGGGGFGQSQHYLGSAAGMDKNGRQPGHDGGSWPPAPQQTQQPYAVPGQNGPYEMYTGPQGPELAAVERPQEVPSPSRPQFKVGERGKW